MAIDPKDMERPDFVFSLDKPAKLMDLLPKADVVVLACPLTAETRGLIGDEAVRGDEEDGVPHQRRPRRPIVQTPTTWRRRWRRSSIAGAGLDVTDPEPLPDGPSACGRCPTVVISPHIGGQSPEAKERQWRLWRENVRRFVAGEPLLCVVDKDEGVLARDKPDRRRSQS